MKNKTHGGKRKKAGRKPVADKKLQIQLYVLTSRVNKIGEEKLKEICYSAIEREFLKP